MKRSYDIIIVGAGIVGLGTALQINRTRPSARILILEKESHVAAHQTGHNSGVLHSGLYYKPGSLKAKNCVEGYTAMVEFCREHGVKHDICGKIVVATTQDEIPLLKNLHERGIANGLKGLRKLSAGELKEIEPHVAGIEGLFVPQTGIVDYKDVCEKMRELLEARGVQIRFNEAVRNIFATPEGTIVETSAGTYRSKLLVTCAGLHSDRVARMTVPELPLRIIPFRGEYYKVKKEKQYLVKNLIYPVPNPAFPFLGVHFTRMIHGGIEAGPNAVFAMKREGYTRTSIDMKDLWESISWPGFRSVAKKYWRTGMGEYYRSVNKHAFTSALQKLIPEIRAEDLIEGGSGVRAQACDIQGGLLDDFYILDKKNIVHVCNAPSPAATSSLSIGKAIASLVQERIN
jgi:L-2-hydroxyglutarate oxidase